MVMMKMALRGDRGNNEQYTHSLGKPLITEGEHKRGPVLFLRASKPS